MLVVTGGEALFADLGHIGKKPIRQSWFAVVYPALVLNYLGQGGWVLSGNEVIDHNIFFSMIVRPSCARIAAELLSREFGTMKPEGIGTRVNT